jgi:hypothetical protein
LTPNWARAGIEPVTVPGRRCRRCQRMITIIRGSVISCKAAVVAHLDA